MAADHDGDPVYMTRLQWDIDRVARDWPELRLTATKEVHGLTEPVLNIAVRHLPVRASPRLRRSARARRRPGPEAAGDVGDVAQASSVAISTASVERSPTAHSSRCPGDAGERTAEAAVLVNRP